MLQLKPEILTHPHIPKPLHGLNPRTLMGDIWWNVERKKAYDRTGYRCIACGVPKHLAKKHKWLEAHEFWSINYETGVCEVKSIEPLCHYCHNFIHSGRLSMILNKEKSRTEIKEILEHGFKILADNNLNAFPFTIDFAQTIGARTFGVKAYNLPKNAETLKWGDYKMIFNGKEYPPLHNSHAEWKHFYNK